MASRMDRYYRSELSDQGRSSKNRDLYKQIENLDSYSNIEGVATIEKTNEIDISKVKEMLKNRENYKKHKRFKNILAEEKEETEEEMQKLEEQRNYDIRDVLSKAKDEETKQVKKYRSLDEEQYRLLNKLKKKENNYNLSDEDMKSIINTSSSDESYFDDLSDDVGLLDDLKSNTMVGDATSIKKIIEEEKNFEIDDNENTTEIDKSFYTSSFGFTQKDFEELKNINHKIKKGNKFIIVLLIILIVLIVLGAIYFIVL